LDEEFESELSDMANPDKVKDILEKYSILKAIIEFYPEDKLRQEEIREK